jgi:hypothetical protein
MVLGAGGGEKRRRLTVVVKKRTRKPGKQRNGGNSSPEASAAVEELEEGVAVEASPLQLEGRGDVELLGGRQGHGGSVKGGQWPRGGVGGELRVSVFLRETPGTEGKRLGERGKWKGAPRRSPWRRDEDGGVQEVASAPWAWLPRSSAPGCLRKKTGLPFWAGPGGPSP